MKNKTSDTPSQKRAKFVKWLVTNRGMTPEAIKKLMKGETKEERKAITRLGEEYFKNQ